MDFFNRRPEGWREDYRIGVLARQMTFGKPPDITKIFPSLAVLAREDGKARNSMDGFKNSGLADLLRNARGGAKPERLFQE